MIIKSKRKLQSLLNDLSLKNYKIGAISGGYDIFHDGHKSSIEFASKQVDKLFVLVNSDESIKVYKGKQRPFNNYSKRVDLLNREYPSNIYIKLDELTPNSLLETIRPNVYFIAQEWSKSPVELKVLDKINCNIITHPQIEGISTTSLSIEQATSKSAIFFDRDGTINEDYGYINKVSLLKIPKSNLEAMYKFAQLPYSLFIVTNQSGVSKKLISKKEFYEVNNEFIRKIEDFGGRIDKVYYDFSSSLKPSKCRKPNIGMVLKAVKEYDISLVNSWVIGDKDSDIELGKNCNMRTIYIKNSRYKYDSVLKPDFMVSSLLESFEVISQELY